MTGQRILYLDTGVLRRLWKLHSGDWPKPENKRRIEAERLRLIIRNNKQLNLAAAASVFCVIEMAQFDQGKHYARMRLDGGDDPMETLHEWGRPSERWRHVKELLLPVLNSASKGLDSWAQSGDRSLVTFFHGPWPNPAPAVEIPLLLGFVLRLCLLTPIDPDDCFHIAYMFRYCDAILTTDQGLLSALKRTLRDEAIMNKVRADYLETFKVELPPSKFRAFAYPEGLDALEQWARSASSAARPSPVRPT